MDTNKQFETLIGRYIDGSASVLEVSELEDLLRDNESNRMHFIELMNIDSALVEASVSWQLEVDERNSQDNQLPAPPVVIPGRRFALTRVASIAACITFIVGMTLMFVNTPAPFATVAHVAGNSTLTQGTPIHNKLHNITNGSVELVTELGARVVIEAPATFQFESSQKLQLIRGRLAADVPESAIGFTVSTIKGDVVDLGTQFGVDVPQIGETEVHVFKGEVVTHTQDGERNSVKGGQAVTLQNNGSISRELRSSAFILPEEAALLSVNLNPTRLTTSMTATTSIRNDPDMITYLDFENKQEHTGNFRIVQGRWPGTHAAEFVEAGEHLKVNVGSDKSWPQFTIAAWVRIDRMGAPYQSILHTNGWGNNKHGQVHWMINRDTTMRLALFGNTLSPQADELHGYPDSRTPVLNQQGHWVHLVTVYNSETGKVRFYLNGLFDKETQQAIAHPARFGPSQIGNWDLHDRKLSGRIDELFIIGRAMSDHEIKTLFIAGDPYGRIPL